MMSSYKLGFTCANGMYINKLIKILYSRNPKKYFYGFDANISGMIKNHFIFNDVWEIPYPCKKNYISTLFNNLSNIGKSILIFGSDEEAIKASKYIQKLNQTQSRFNLMKHETIKILVNKYNLYKLIQNKGTKNFIKPFRKVKSKIEVENFINDLGGKKNIILKPLIGRGSRNVYLINVENKYIETDDKRISLIKLNEIPFNIFKENSFIAMEYIEGKSITIDVLANQGEIIQLVPRLWLNGKKNKKIIQRNIINDNIINLVEIINDITNIHGLIDIDAKIDNKGNIFFLEVNPRPSGSAYATELMGIPIFSMLENLLLEKKIIPTKISKIKEVVL